MALRAVNTASARWLAIGLTSCALGGLLPGSLLAQGGAPKPAADAKPQAAAAPVGAQLTLASLAGTWDGIARTGDGDMPVHVVLTYKDGKLTGAIESAMGTMPITNGTVNGDTAELAFDMQGVPGTLSGKFAGDKCEGSWSVGAESGPFALARVPAAGATAAGAATGGATAGGAAVPDSISGEWTGEISIAGQAMAFTLTLKLTGETLTGEIGSAAGQIPLTSAGWKNGTLSMAFPYVAGEPVSMSGQIVEGKLTGVIDYNQGEQQGTWTAVKKKV